MHTTFDILKKILKSRERIICPFCGWDMLLMPDDTIMCGNPECNFVLRE